MRVLYVAMKYDYGRPDQGCSFEHNTFFDSLNRMGHDILYFDFMSLMQQRGRAWMNRRLQEAARAEKAPCMFACLFGDELDRKVMRRISEGGVTTTLNWFCDDQWRFDRFSSRWAPCFNWVTTTAKGALPKYERIGCRNVIKTQWACNQFQYRPTGEPERYDVTFIGRRHSDRPQVIQRLLDAGIDVRVWGDGWPAGRAGQEEMIRIFSTSRVNLSLSNASVGVGPPITWRMRARHYVSRALDYAPGGRAFKDALRRRRLARAAPAPPPKVDYFDQIKGRDFEVPGCGGFLLTGRAENFGDYYRVGEEAACYESPEDLLEKVRYYLQHDEERQAIARRGYERTLREHTYVHRFDDIFRRLRLPSPAVADALAEKVAPGQVEYIH